MWYGFRKREDRGIKHVAFRITEIYTCYGAGIV
jgi:hypothetical protein